MSGFVIPAIDIHNGKCVRLTSGKLNKIKVYHEDPLNALRFWIKKGADLIHIVDLDAAFGIGNNYELIEKMVSLGDIKIQMGGGIRSEERAAKLIELGISRIVIGTAAVRNPQFVKKLSEKFGSDRIIVALDHKGGKPAVKGWTEIINTDVFKLGSIMEENGAGYVLMSSVEADGTLKGPDLENTKKMVEYLSIPVIAAGGIRNKEDIINLKKIGVAAVIVGKAFYEGLVDFDDVKNI